ncbi:MAG: signal peptidase II [Oscillospiraceae bacterium]|nr:signal peptidase II [Oscillospiraceae bacterium]
MIWLIISILIILSDQAVKYFIASGMGVGETLFPVLNIFDITYVQNRGAAFSILSGKMPILSIISIAFCIGVVVYWIKKRPTHPLLCTAVTMMFAGAFSNAIDRIFRGFVVDYIRTLFIDFPVFNIADIGITVGAALLVVYFIFFDKEGKDAKNKTETD